MGNPLTHPEKEIVKKHTKEFRRQITEIISDYTKEVDAHIKSGKNPKVDSNAYNNKRMGIRNAAMAEIAHALTNYLEKLGANMELYIGLENKAPVLRLNQEHLENLFDNELSNSDMISLIFSDERAKNVNNKLSSEIDHIGSKVIQCLNDIEHTLNENNKSVAIKEVEKSTRGILTALGDIVASICNAISKVISHIIPGKTKHEPSQQNIIEENKANKDYLEQLASEKKPELVKLSKKLALAAKEAVNQEISHIRG